MHYIANIAYCIISGVWLPEDKKEKVWKLQTCWLDSFNFFAYFLQCDVFWFMGFAEKSESLSHSVTA